MSQKEPVRISWEFTTNASVEQTWSVFSDTDRFNRSVGLGFRFDESPTKDGTVRRVGRARFLGLNLSWDELPFQFRENQWYRTRRIFHSGPAAEYTVIMRLRPQEKGGTSIRYTVEVIPRTMLTKPVVMLELKANTQPRLDKGLKALLGELEDATGAIDPAAPPLSAEVAARLETICGQIEPAEVGRRLRDHITHAPLYQQNQMSPLKFAEAWEMEEDDVIRGFLAAVREGALSLRWDLICPLCQGAKRRVTSLVDPELRRVHCPSCNIHYDGSFPDSVAVSFRTNEALRAFEIPVECIGSPSRQPQLVAQDILGRSDEGTLEMVLDLSEGSYRVRTWPHRQTVSLEVREGAEPTSMELVVTQDALVPSMLRARPGQVVLALKNATDRPIDVLLERRWRSAHVLTGGRLMELPEARSILSADNILPDIDVEVERGVVFAVEGFTGANRALVERLTAHGAHMTCANERVVLGVFRHAKRALRAAADLAMDPSARCSLNIGAVTRITAGGRKVPVGKAVDAALIALVGAQPCRPVIPVDAAADPEFVEAARNEGVKVVAANFACTPRTHVHFIEFGSMDA